MNMQTLLSRIMGFLVIIITLALAPEINTQNGLVAAANLTNCIGMTAIVDFGAPLIVLGLLAMGGLFAWKGTSGASMKDILGVIGAVVLAIVALTFMVDIVDYTNTLIDASTGFAVTLYGMIPLVVYLTIIASIGFASYRAFKGGKKDKKDKKAAAVANY